MQTSKEYSSLDFPLILPSITNLCIIGLYMEERKTANLKFEKESWQSRNICWSSMIDLSFSLASRVGSFGFLALSFPLMEVSRTHSHLSATICRIWTGIL